MSLTFGSVNQSSRLRLLVDGVRSWIQNTSPA